ncbi:hypothetical protein PHISCL_07137 [Aspergillus sclerotialis]|uniref:Aminoglycoside phosphotransferase domain-containing protein n=1 Tax=Aspergillus sclerotialis TaxID=2070753 RepID=A0A3A2ZU45_9EURO|nr:hypothetical protein PHISCL_07137 [Aspergillus sclerotialis]
MIGSGEIDSSCPVDTYLVHQLRQDLVGALSEDIPPDSQFYLKHPDDKDDHILVNDSFDIVGVIDWEWTQTVSWTEAFCSPCMMWPVAEFHNGSNELAAEELRLAAIFREKGRGDLADCVIKGRKVQRFFFALGPDSFFVNVQTLQHLLKGLQRAFNLEYEEFETWKNEALNRGKDDNILLGLLDLNNIDRGIRNSSSPPSSKHHETHYSRLVKDQPSAPSNSSLPTLIICTRSS